MKYQVSRLDNILTPQEAIEQGKKGGHICIVRPDGCYSFHFSTSLLTRVGLWVQTVIFPDSTIIVSPSTSYNDEDVLRVILTKGSKTTYVTTLREVLEFFLEEYKEKK